MNLIKKNFKIYTFISIIFPAFLLCLLEGLMAIIYFINGSKYIENSIESYSRTNTQSRESIFKIESVGTSENNPTKIAIFGGSSAAGAATPWSFAKILANKDVTKKNFIIHNYAKSGEPFVGFQSEVLKAVISKYDILIIYAGHNEVHQQHFARARNLGNSFVLPNGLGLYTQFPYANLEKRLEYINNNLHNLKPEVNTNFLTWMAERSRIKMVMSRISYKLNEFLAPPALQQIKFTPRFYYTDEFITTDERKQISEQFENEIKEISLLLRDNQKLVLSTLLSNDLFPPIADVLKENATESIIFEGIAKKSYAYLAASDYQKLEMVLKELPSGAHKTFLESIVCLSKGNFKIFKSEKCLRTAETARGLDGYPLRVVPEINSFIKAYKHKNVIVVDPVKIMEESALDLADYNSFFIDFQHPSSKGYFVIFNEIMVGLFDNFETLKNKYTIDMCSNLNIKKGSQQILMNPDPDFIRLQFNINMAWLDRFISMQPTAYPYDVYKQRAQNNLALCKQNLN